MLFLFFLFLSVTDSFQPDGAIGRYDNGKYIPQGEFYNVEGLDLYLARNGQASDGTRGILWSHDIYGWKEGRTMEIVDQLAENSQFSVVLPNFYRDVVWPDAVYYNWTRQGQSDWEDRIIPFLDSLGITSVGIVGNCVGSYFTLHASAYPNVKCGFSTHPAHVEVTAYYPDETAADLYPAVVANGALQYFGPSLEEGPEYRPGGEAEQMLGDLLTIVEYPCHHGFFSRGNLSDPTVADCNNQAWADLEDFFGNCL